MSTNEKSEPSDNQAITYDEFVNAIEIIEKKFSKAITDVERRTDEAMAHRDNTIRAENKANRDEIAIAINQLSEGMRALAQHKGGAAQNSNFISELIELAKPAIQRKMIGEVPEDDLTSQVNQLGMLTVRGTLRELLNAQKLQVRRMMRKGDLSVQDVRDSPVADILLDKALDNHARL